MKTQERKWIPIERTVHQKLKEYAVKNDIPMKTLVEEYVRTLLEGGDRREDPNAVSPSR
jgi:hypothetical protein